MSFRSHFDMISLNEPVTRKAKFWQSYVRALKGTEDMRADDGRLKLRPRALSEFPEFGRSLYGDSTDPNDRIFSPGYRYLPISRETYGYSPRPIHGPIAGPRYAPRPFSVPPEGIEREGSPFYRDASPFGRENTPYGRDSTPFIKDTDPFIPETPVPSSYYPRSYYTRPFARSVSPVRTSALPLYATRPSLSSRPYSDLLNPSPYMPVSALTRDPWWYDAYGLRPYSYYPTYPSSLRNSFLSPVKNRYLWTRHPMRPL